MQRLTGKTCVVTGGAGGIGAAICTAFANEGARVVVTDIDEQKGQQFADGLPAGAVFRRLDVTDEAQWIATLDSLVDVFGGLDVLVNNAGVTGTGKVPHDPEFT